MSNAEVAAALAQEVLPKFSVRIEAVDIVEHESYNPQRPPYQIEHECSAISQQDVFYGIKEILVELATKGAITIIDGKELDEMMMDPSTAVARFGKLSLTFTSYFDCSASKHCLKIFCWYRPVLVMAG
ncbi:MAG TPA: hypothetical protein VGN17_01020 [Bryobacteraceae bacterium]